MTHQEAQVFLTSLLSVVRNNTAGIKPINFPVQIVDHPEIASFIFKNPALFSKNYLFFELFTKGRFTSNGSEWLTHSNVTHSFYSEAFTKISHNKVYDIYLSRFQQLALIRSVGLNEALLSAALDVMSAVFQITEGIPWHWEKSHEMVRLLTIFQARSWTENSGFISAAEAEAITNFKAEIKSKWLTSPGMRGLFERLINQFPQLSIDFLVDEFIQNILAATETAASSFLWMIACLSEGSGIDQKSLRANDNHMDCFIEEVLRLFPPIPFVTRISGADQEMGGMKFLTNEALLVSIIGLHTRLDSWKNPSDFLFPRPEFLQDTYLRNTFRPFISGPRVCAGMKIALLELSAGLKAILDTFEIAHLSVRQPYTYGLTYKPANALDELLIPLN